MSLCDIEIVSVGVKCVLVFVLVCVRVDDSVSVLVGSVDTELVLVPVRVIEMLKVGVRVPNVKDFVDDCSRDKVCVPDFVGE